MTDHPDLSVQQSDALWDAVAIPGPETPTFAKQHERVCKAVAEMLHLATAPREDVPQPDGSEAGCCPHCGRGDSAPTPDAYEQQRQRADQARATLDDVLGHFTHKGHPGEPCLSSGWVREQTVARWRAVLYPPTPAATEATQPVVEIHVQPDPPHVAEAVRDVRRFGPPPNRH